MPFDLEIDENIKKIFYRERRPYDLDEEEELESEEE